MLFGNYDLIIGTEITRNLRAQACVMRNKHTHKYFPNLIKLNRNQIVYTIFRLILDQTDIRSVTNQSENGEYNLISI